MEFLRTSALAPGEIEWVRHFLTGRPLFQLYFESALRAAAAGLDNRSVLIGEARRGLALSIDFENVTIRTTAGELSPGELALVAATQRRAELHLEPAHLALVLQAVPARIADVKTLRYYRLAAPTGTSPDPRCRRLDATYRDEAAAFFHRHYPATIFSAWMLEGPFFGLFEGGELLACGGAIASDPALGACNVGNFLTHPGHRGRGLAQAVTRTLVAHLERAGFSTFLLGTFAENAPACRAYEAVGFRLEEERPQVDVKGLNPTAP